MMSLTPLQSTFPRPSSVNTPVTTWIPGLELPNYLRKEKKVLAATSTSGGATFHSA